MIIKSSQKPKKPVRKTSVVQTRLDPVLREKTDMILSQLGLSTSDAVRIFFEQITLHRGLPFEVKLPQAPMNPALETQAWDEKTELKFQNALNAIEKKYGHALKNLADIQ